MATSAEELLKQLVTSKKGETPVSGDVLLNGVKVGNKYLKEIVSRLKARNIGADEIITTILALDELVESGKADESVFDNLKQK
jgi:hypothetical protein